MHYIHFLLTKMGGRRLRVRFHDYVSGRCVLLSDHPWALGRATFRKNTKKIWAQGTGDDAIANIIYGRAQNTAETEGFKLRRQFLCPKQDGAPALAGTRKKKRAEINCMLAK